MSIKSFIQILLLLLIISIVTIVYFKYFDTNKNIVEEINSIEIENQEKITRLEEKLSELELKNTESLIVDTPIYDSSKFELENLSFQILNQSLFRIRCANRSFFIFRYKIYDLSY